MTEVPVLASSHVTQAGGPYGLSDSQWRLSCMTGTLLM